MIAPGQLIYVEQKTGWNGNGPAWITAAKLSRSGRTVYFAGRALRAIGGSGVRGNFVCAETGDEYWLSGVKRAGGDRHAFGSGPIQVDARVLEAYLRLRGRKALDPQRYVVVHDIADTDVAAFHARENTRLEERR